MKGAHGAHLAILVASPKGGGSEESEDESSIDGAAEACADELWTAIKDDDKAAFTEGIKTLAHTLAGSHEDDDKEGY
jgi:hypothetical protein